MTIFAIGDLHLSHHRDKPMDIFGGDWVNHTARISDNWNRVVGAEDLVIVAGDISWAMHLSEALVDLKWLAELNGSKLLVRGNHDYWWSSISRVRALLPETVYALQNDHFAWDDYLVCGTRGWLCPGEEGFDDEHDQKIFQREVQRLHFSLESTKGLEHSGIIAVLHFPPFNRNEKSSDFTALLEQYGVKICVFGHIHDSGREHIFQGIRNGVSYRFVAADGIGFTPLKLV